MGDSNPDTIPDWKVLMLLPVPEPTKVLQGLRSEFPNVTFEYHEVKFSGSDAFRAENKPSVEVFHDADILFTLSELPPAPKTDAPKLQWVHLFSAGIDICVNHPIYTETNVKITTSSGVHGPQIAEWVILTALVYSHQYNELHDFQKEHVWGKKVGDIHRLHDMVGQRIGILGYGSIGRQVGRIARAMAMDVIAYTASSKDTKEAKRDHGYIVEGTGDPNGEFPSKWFSGLDKQGLHEFLDQDLDILLISLPLTDDTKGFIGEEEFAILKNRRTFISNISRGQIIDQTTMINALRNEHIRGAALDVTDPEPLPEDNPLWDMPNVIITPHISGLGSAYAERSFGILKGNMQKLAKGEPLWNIVDRKRGY